MTAKILPNPVFRALDSVGAVLNGGYVLTFSAGTSDQKDVYTEKTGTTPHNVTGTHAGESGFDLGTYGEAEVFWGAGQYKLVFYNSADVIQNTVDDFDPQVQDTATPGNNLVLNGSFETDSDGDGTPDNWTLSAATDLISTTQRKHGTNALKFTSTGTVASGTALTTAKIPVNLRHDLDIMFELYAATTSEQTRVRLKFYQADGTTFISNTDVLDAVATSGAAWIAHRYRTTPPALAGWVEIEIQGITNTLAGGEVYLDEVRMSEVVVEITESLPRGYMSGLTISNGTDASHDIDIAVGECRDGGDANNMVVATTLVKQIDAAWAVGTAAGGIDTGTVANDTWYHLWLIRRSDTGVVDALFSLSATAPSMPTNYDQKRRVGSVLYGTALITLFFSREVAGGGLEVTWDVPAGDVNTPASTTATPYALSTPLGLKTKAIGYVTGSYTAAYYVLVSDPDQSTPVASGNKYTLSNNLVATVSQTARVEAFTDTSSQLEFVATVAMTATVFSTHGWIDDRRD